MSIDNIEADAPYPRYAIKPSTRGSKELPYELWKQPGEGRYWQHRGSHPSVDDAERAATQDLEKGNHL